MNSENFVQSVFDRARSMPRRIVLPEGAEPRILRAAAVIRKQGLAEPTLLGAEQEVRAAAAACDADLADIEIIDPQHSAWRELFAETYFELRKHKGVAPEQAAERVVDVNYFGTMMVHTGRADGMVSGSVHTTGATIRPALEIIRTRPGSSIVSSVFFMCLPQGVLVYGDCAVNPNPTAEQLADIATCSADTAAAFGIQPRVAMLCYATGDSAAGPDVEVVRAATQIAKPARPDLPLDGPIQYDAAIDPEIGRAKLPGSEVAGQATVLIFPSLSAGNIAYKAVQRSTDCLAIGPVLQGLNKPINDLSRGCTVDDIVNTVAATAVQAQSANETNQ